MTGQAEAKVHAAMAGKADTDTSGQLLQTVGPVQKSSGALKEAAIGRAFSNAFSMGVALMLVLLLVMAGLNYQNNRQFNEDANWVAQTHEVQTLASNIVLALVDAETGQQGFVTTGNTAFLQSYDAALVRLDGLMATLKDKTQDNAGQLARVAGLQALSARQLADWRQAIDLRRRSAQDAAAFVAAGAGKAQMDVTRMHIADMIQVEDKLLADRQKKTATTYQYALITGLLVPVMALGIFGAFAWLLRRALARQQRDVQLSRSLMDGTSDCIKVLDLSGRLLQMNTPGLHIMGIDDFALVQGQPWQVLWPADAQGDVTRSINAAKGGETASFQAYGQTVKGVPKWWEATVSPVRNAQGGQVVRLLAVSRDITERKRAEQLLRERTAVLQAISEANPDSIFVKDRDSRMVFVNPATLRAIGLNEQDIIGKSEAQWHPVMDEAQALIANDRRIMAAGKSEVVEEIFTGPSGRRTYLATKTPMRDEGGAVVGIIGISRDISDQKRAEDALRESEERFRTATAAVSDLIWTNTADGLMTGKQPGWEDFTGQSQDQYQGYGWSHAIHPDDAQSTVDSWMRAVAEKRVFQFEHRVRRHDGQWRLCLVRAVPVFNDDATIREWVGVHADITETKRNEKELQLLAAKLSEADRRKDEFLATLAHELRNPLAPLRNGLQLIKLAGVQQASIEQARSMMERQLAQMVRLIDDLMDVSRINQGKLELRKERIPLAVVLDSAVESTRPLIGQMGHELTVTLPEQALMVDADMTRLAQAFVNLLNNAAKYSERGGRIRLSVERLGTDAVVTVKDTGIGISAEQLPRIFEMFTQVEQSLEKSQGGLGIGLTLVKRLVELHGGSVKASSDGPGKGSEFVVYLPLAMEASPSHALGTESESAALTLPLRILVVDDNRDAADSMSEMLEMLGHDTRTAYDGQHGVDMAGDYRPDVILFDIGMPKLNGYKACRLVRQQPWGQGIIVVAVTGWGQDKDLLGTREAGFDHHLVKPIDPQALMKILADLHRNCEAGQTKAAVQLQPQPQPERVDV